MKPIYEQRLDNFYKELEKKAEWIGEDGDMVCAAIGPRAAFKKFKQLMLDDLGPREAEEMSMDYIGTAWLILPISDDDGVFDGEQNEWFVSYVIPHENRPSRPIFRYAV